MDTPDETSCQLVIAIFAVAFAMALAASWATAGALLSVRALEWFVAFSVCLVAIRKLQDLESFSTMFLNSAPASGAAAMCRSASSH